MANPWLRDRATLFYTGFGLAGTAATSALSGTATGLSLIVLLVAAAIATRRQADWHKRLVMLATVQLLWPAFFRLCHWFPAVPNPDIWFGLVLAYSPILVAAWRDKLRYGAVHKVWHFIAPKLVFEQVLEVMFFDRGIQRAFGQWRFSILVR